jgi:bifunctional DNA-binding transcriptional regulator/antitoxin component of YhaV-PrlF toxin-antitoxin module
MQETIIVRPRRQITLPRQMCEALGVEPGDRLVLDVEGGVLVARPQRQVALDALDEVRRALAESGVTEEELLEGGRQVRKELFREKYPELAAKYRI